MVTHSYPPYPPTQYRGWSEQRHRKGRGRGRGRGGRFNPRNNDYNHPRESGLGWGAQQQRCHRGRDYLSVRKPATKRYSSGRFGLRGRGGRGSRAGPNPSSGKWQRGGKRGGDYSRWSGRGKRRNMERGRGTQKHQLQVEFPAGSPENEQSEKQSEKQSEQQKSEQQGSDQQIGKLSEELLSQLLQRQLQEELSYRLSEQTQEHEQVEGFEEEGGEETVSSQRVSGCNRRDDKDKDSLMYSLEGRSCPPAPRHEPQYLLEGFVSFRDCGVAPSVRSGMSAVRTTSNVNKVSVVKENTVLKIDKQLEDYRGKELPKLQDVPEKVRNRLEDQTKMIDSLEEVNHSLRRTVMELQEQLFGTNRVPSPNSSIAENMPADEYSHL